MKYLNNFSSLIPALQGNKAIKRVEDLRAAGSLQTEDEYNNAIKNVLSTISTSEFKPTFQFIPFKESLSSSEHYNYLLNQIRDDLEVAFIELNNIYTVIKAHQEICKDKIIDDLYFSIREIENKIEAYSLISDLGNAFDDVYINSFSGNNYLLEATNRLANELYFDSRLGSKIVDAYLAKIDTKEEIVSLPLSTQTDIYFSSAQILTAESSGTEVNIQLENSSLNSVITQGSNSSWVYNVLSKKDLKDGAKLVLELDFGDVREINYLFIHPISDFPLFINKIQYINNNNLRVDLPDTSIFGTTIDKPVKITFSDILAKRIILEVVQQSSVLFDYDVNRPLYTLEDLKRNANIPQSTALLTDIIQQNIQDPQVLSIVSSPQTQKKNYEIYYLYSLAFKDLHAGIIAYKNNGYFISNAYRKYGLGRLGLETSEINIEYFNPAINDTSSVGSFEYYIVKKDYNGLNELLSTVELPILPSGQQLIENELLGFSKLQKIIPLRFLAHSSLNSGSGIKILRNDVELIRGVDWRFADRLNPADSSDVNLSPSLYETRIEILHNDDVIQTGKYTANYTPRYISEANVPLTLPNQVRYIANNVVEHSIPGTFYSDLYVKIFIRNNSFMTNKTPKINYYKLLLSTIKNEI